MARRCLFLDRDGVINRKPAAGEYVTEWRDFHLIPAAIDWIRLLKAAGFLIVVVTNQRGVARGKMTAQQLTTIHEQMLAVLAEYGAEIDDVFVCPHDENVCGCRKPRPGLILQAQEKWNIDLATSLFIGDSPTDRELANICGIPFVHVYEGRILEITAPLQAVPS